MNCSKEEIERKRLAALRKRQSKSNTSPVKPISPSTSSLNQPKTISTSNIFKKSGHHPYPKFKNNDKYENLVPVDKVVSGTVYLITETRFEVNPSEFCPPLINIFKSLPSKCYDPLSKLWNFLIDDYQDLMSRVALLAPHIVLGGLPNYIIKILKEPMVDPGSIDLSPVEATLRNKLMPFQEEGVRFGIAKRGRCMIADDMGLGKTFQALALASYYQCDWPLLIVTTSSMRETWQRQIQELLPSVPLANVASLRSGRDATDAAAAHVTIVLCSYKLLSAHTAALSSKRFGVVIVDESHNLKSHKAQCTAALAAIARPAARVVLLSGTPALSRPAELFTQLHLLQPNFTSFMEYGKRYCAGKLTHFGWDMTGQSNLAELQILLQKKFLIRRTKEQVLPTLEKKTREAVLLDQTLLEFTAEQKQGLRDMARIYTQTRTKDKHAALLSFFSESARVKIPAICKYIKQIIREDDSKFLVFAHHRNVIEAISLTLDELRVGYICVVGSTPAPCRAELVDRFQSSDACRGAVLSLTAAGAGLTLTAARLVLFAELHWNPGVLTQAEGRAHRIGQSGAVHVRYLLAGGTCDDVMWPMLQGKLNVLNEVGLSKDSFENTTSKHQESKTNIVQYLSPRNDENKSDFIPDTNIMRDATNRCSNTGGGSAVDGEFNSDIDFMFDDEFQKSFLEDEEGDELLANVDL